MDWERLGEELYNISCLLERTNNILEAIAKVVIKPDSYMGSGRDCFGDYEYQVYATKWNSDELFWEYEDAKET